MAIAGAGAISMAVTANTTIQSVVPDQLRGRVMSVYTTVFAGSVPVGGLVMGAIASAWGAPVALGLGGVLTAGVGIGAWVWVRRIRAVERTARGRAGAVPAGGADPGALTQEGPVPVAHR
jgi:MFS family permease